MKITEVDGKLAITDFSEEEAYEIACNIEKEGLRFYNKLKETHTDAKIVEILNVMLKDEAEHLKFFESAREQLQETLEQETEDNDLIMSMNFGIFKPYEDIENLNEVISDGKKALKLGALVENRAIDFYRQCREKVSSESTKRELDKIISEEIKHRDLFEQVKNKIS